MLADATVPAFTFVRTVPPVPPSETVLFVALLYTTASDSPVDGSIRPLSFSDCSTLVTRLLVANSCAPLTASVLVDDSVAARTLVSLTAAAPVPPRVTEFFAPESYSTAFSAPPPDVDAASSASPTLS
ncbi:hypothetical protein BamIOP4010DRAFT_6119 [Burkholderia ambifaria IOP40-10]|uniref:Uncharacterized protein n=1 Tax=Burkholderia ambifaria IOP40-10 TaxID=396596 RepID=B1FQ08_9BURK|nr:hypothetical protein BamIOP4010DRAFT_6119 [Burkholderia ambifaria IOP40-10]